MIGGSVWGRPTLGSSSTPPLTSSLARQFDKIGLDGPICAEYILSLLDMYKTPGDRSAAISDFVMDSISTSSTLTDSQHNQFVAEILEIVGSGGSRGGSGPVAKPSVPQQISDNQTSESVVSKKGFKKGTKLTGMALKQVVGTVKPSFVQKYSDDESSEQVVRRPTSSTMHLTQPSMVVRSISSNSRQSVDPQYFPSLDANSSNGSTSSTSRVTPPETPQIQSPSPPLAASASAAAVSNKKKKNSKVAREVGPDEVWSGDELQESDDGAEFKTPFTSLKEEKKKKQANDAPNSTRKQLSLTGFNSIKISPPPDTVVVKEEPLTTPPPPTNKIVSILDTTPPAAALEPSLLIPQDILSFDFQFEGESDEEKAPAVPETETFDLLRQMFGGFSTNTTTTSVVEPPKIAAPTLNAPPALAKSDREYSTNFLLHVLSSMGPDGVEKPHELQALCVQGEHKRRSPHGDMNGSWRSNNKDAAKFPGMEKEPADHKEEGFW